MLLTRLWRLDLMQWIGDRTLWEELSAAAIEDEVGALPIKVIGYEDLVRLKQLAAGPEV